MERPTAVDPVKATLSTYRGLSLIFKEGQVISCTCICSAIAAPAIFPNPLTIFMTPFSKPAFTTSWANINADRGVCSAVFKTTVQPHAIAGATFH